MKKVFVFLIFLGLGFAFGQQRISYNGSGNYELVERTDLRRYDNGRYKGLVSREVSSFIIPSASDNGFLYDGTFWVLENMRRNGFDVGPGFDEGIPAQFKIGADGQMSMIVDNGFPSYRSFPTFPSGEISVGDSWEAEAVRAVDPLYKGVVTRMPVMVRYTYVGDSFFNGEEVFVIEGAWATRYGMGTGSYYIDFGGDSELRRATGSHKATIYVSKASGNSVLIRDNLDETFVYADGNQIRFAGTVSLFTKYPPAMDRMKFLPALKRVAGLSDEEMMALADPVGEFPENVFGDFSESEGDFGNGVVDGYGDNDNLIAKGGAGGAGNNGGSGGANGGIDDYLWEQVSGNIGDYSEDDVFGSGAENSESLGVSGKGNENINKNGSGNIVAGNKDDKSKWIANAIAGVIDGDGRYGEGGKSSGNVESGKKSDDKKEISIKVDNTPAGVRLTMENLQFLPDSAQLIPGQLGKLDEIAEVLKSVPNGMFLIEGHTASTGYEEGEKKLSIERAESIAREFTARGISRTQIICKGSGGTKPIADNKTYEGKAKNRRVEITILD